MLLCVVSVDSTAVFDVAPVIDELRTLQSDSGWLMLVDGWHKLCDQDFTNAAQLLEGGICICIMVLLLFKYCYCYNCRDYGDRVAKTLQRYCTKSSHNVFLVQLLKDTLNCSIFSLHEMADLIVAALRCGH